MSNQGKFNFKHQWQRDLYDYLLKTAVADAVDDLEELSHSLKSFARTLSEGNSARGNSASPNLPNPSCSPVTPCEYRVTTPEWCRFPDTHAGQQEAATTTTEESPESTPEKRTFSLTLPPSEVRESIQRYVNDQLLNGPFKVLGVSTNELSDTSYTNGEMWLDIRVEADTNSEKFAKTSPGRVMMADFDWSKARR